MNYCIYYHAFLKRESIWLITGILRNEDHWVFDRTLDKNKDLLEFFVAPAYKDMFENYMEFFKEKGLVYEYYSLPNRLSAS